MNEKLLWRKMFTGSHFCLSGIKVDILNGIGVEPN